MDIPRKEYPNRIMIFFTVMILIMTMIVGKLIHVQIFKAEEYHKRAMGQWVLDKRLNSKRGLVFDRNGKKLAVNKVMYSVWCRPKDIKVEELDDTILKLNEVLKIDEEYLRSCLTYKGNNKIVKRWITQELAEPIKELNLRGIDINEDVMRYYPYETVAAQIIGFTNVDNVGISGIEKLYEVQMTGVPGRTVLTKDAHLIELPYGTNKKTSPEDGLSVVLTIDKEIQEKAEKEAYKALQKTKAKNITVVVMDPKSGEILAMTTKPDYNPNKRNDLLYSVEKPWDLMSEEEQIRIKELPSEERQAFVYDRYRNKAITDMYEPGSVFKLITAAAALEENIAGDPFRDAKYFCDGRVTQVAGNLKCWYYPKTHGAETLAQALQNSCNDALAQIALELKQETLLTYIKAFGFGKKTGVGLVGETRGILPNDPNTIKNIELVTMSYGQGKIVVTPIQMATAVSAIVNGGELLQPMIVKEFVDVEGNIVEESEKKIRRRVISKETSALMRKAMEQVVTLGGGKAAKIPGYKIGGKTGTALKVVDGRYADGKFVSSFMGVAPMDDPQLLVLTVVDEPQGSIYGSRVALPVSREILRSGMKILKINPEYTPEEKKLMSKEIDVPNLIGKTAKEADQILNKINLIIDFDTIVYDENDKIIEQYPDVGIQLNPLDTVEVKLKSNE